MKIASTQYSGKYRAFEIYVSGCNGPHCDGCHNEQLWDFDVGEDFNPSLKESLIEKIREFNGLIDKVWILGGEPLDQDLSELLELLTFPDDLGLEVWLFTRREYDEIPIQVKVMCDFIKCGPYIKTLQTDSNVQAGVSLASSNQKIYWLNKISK